MVIKVIDDVCCDIMIKKRVREINEVFGALWYIYDVMDVDKIRDFFNKVLIDILNVEIWFILELKWFVICGCSFSFVYDVIGINSFVM